MHNGKAGEGGHLHRAADACEELWERERQRNILFQQVLGLGQPCNVVPLHPQGTAPARRHNSEQEVVSLRVFRTSFKGHSMTMVSECY